MQATNSVSQAREYWNYYADRWQKQANNTQNFYTKRNQWLKQLIQKNEIVPCTTLDIGCSTGQLSEVLAGMGFDPYGSDVSDKLVNHAVERMSVKYSDAEKRFLVSIDGKNPFTDRMFKLATIIGVFPYIENQKKYIENLSGQIEAGGYIIASGANRVSIYVFLHILKHILWFRPNRTWWETLVNLARTGIWSGGYLVYKKAEQVHNSSKFDALFEELGYQKVDEFDLYHISFFDKNPLRRKGINKALARLLGWSHVGVFRKKNI